MKRPECFEFAMDFLGNPEEPIIRQYVEMLEDRIAELEAAQQTVASDLACSHSSMIFEPGTWVCADCGQRVDPPSG